MWIFEQPTYSTNDSGLSSFFIKMYKLGSHNCECTQLRCSQSSEAKICKCLSSENVNWIDVVCCHEHLNK